MQATRESLLLESVSRHPQQETGIGSPPHPAPCCLRTPCGRLSLPHSPFRPVATQSAGSPKPPGSVHAVSANVHGVIHRHQVCHGWQRPRLAAPQLLNMAHTWRPPSNSDPPGKKTDLCYRHVEATVQQHASMQHETNMTGTPKNIT